MTVSAFLAAGLLDRLHVAVAPFLIGAGRPAIRLPAPDLLRECARPQHRVFRMGTDVLFDCDLRTEDDTPRESGEGPPITRILEAAAPADQHSARGEARAIALRTALSSDAPSAVRSQRLQELDQRRLLRRRQVER